MPTISFEETPTPIRYPPQWRPSALLCFGDRSCDRSNFNVAFHGNPRARLVFFSLADELDGIEIAFRDFAQTLERTRQSVFAAVDDPEHAVFPEWDAGLFHYAKTFIYGVRRFARLLEKAGSKIGARPKSLRDAVQLTWKGNKAFFERYTAPRNTMEHVEEMISDDASLFSQHLVNGRLYVARDLHADVNSGAMSHLLGVWDDIAKAGFEEFQRFIGSIPWRTRLVRALQASGDAVERLRLVQRADERLLDRHDGSHRHTSGAVVEPLPGHGAGVQRGA